MNLEDLRERRRRERQQDSLQQLSDSFYRDAAVYLDGLKEARSRAAAAAGDPYDDPEVRRLTDELQTATSVVESLYERRVGKVVKHASFAAADMPHDEAGLTDEERALFGDLVDRIRENRTRVLDALDGGTAEPPDETASSVEEAPEPATDEPEPAPSEAAQSEPASSDPAGMLAAAMGGASEGDEAASPEDPPERASSDESAVPEGDPPEPTPDEATERTTVRVTADVGEIYGVDDRSYRLEAEDVVDLPADNAAPLVEKGAAERL